MALTNVLGLLIGIGLSAACGFRVFVPLLGIGIAYQTGYLSLSPGFEWIGSEYAIVAFSVATILEIAAYYIPWIDNLLDTIAAPAAIIAGTLITASVIGDVSPLFRWSLAIIAGGASSGIISASMGIVRAGSTASTGGMGNFIVSTGELVISIFGVFISIIFPIAAVAMFILFVCFMFKKGFWKKLKKDNIKTSRID